MLHISGDYDDMFISLFEKYCPALKFTTYDIQKEQYPRDLTEFSGFLSSGSPSAVYDNDNWIGKYQKFTQRLFSEKRKHVGICFGHQMIAKALGGEVKKAASGWGIGVTEINMLRNEAWMGNEISKYSLIVSHQDQVSKLPEKAVLLAGNGHCPIGMFRMDHYALGIQQHPEFTAVYSKALMLLRKKIIDPQLIENALKTLDQKTDSDKIAGLIEKFLKL